MSGKEAADSLALVYRWLGTLGCLGVACVVSMARAQPACRNDGALARAAAVALLSNERGAFAIRDALAEVESDLVGARALFVPRPDGSTPMPDAESAWLSELAARADAPLVCGRALGESGELVIAAPRAARLQLRQHDTTRVFGWLAPGFDEPVLVVLGADGQLSRRVVSRAMLSAGVDLDRSVQRPARLQLVATGRFGPRPVAERVVLGNAPRSVARSSGLPPSPDPQAPIRGSLNRLRRARGVPAVRRHALLRRLAAEHAYKVCESGRVAHALAIGADPTARLEARGVRAQRVGETVARAEGPAAAFAALTQSPSHLLALVEPGFTDAGVGVATDATGHACVVVLLARWPRFVGS